MVGRALSTLLFVAVVAHADAAVALASPFAAHAVLQRDQLLPIWGSAAPGAAVVVRIGGHVAKAKADAGGSWRVVLDKLPAGGPHVLEVEAGSERVAVEDVLIGDVWIAVGQSNMMMDLGMVDGGSEAAKRFGELPGVRMSHEKGPQLIQERPATSVAVHWAPPQQSDSAVAFFFAETAYRYFKGQVPIGVLAATDLRMANAGERL